MKRSVLLALVAQLAIVGMVAAPRLLVRVTGDEYRLRVRPVDPIDPFRGAYVDLAYVGFERPDDAEVEKGRVYVLLRRDGDAWVGSGVVAERPESGPYVACESDGWTAKCGIESWFLSQERAQQVEDELGDGGIARVRIGGSGRAVLVAVE
ncbi:MAG TPA: GDYXXLXY domain-containing protein [Frankiaceae bacterium]|nr:GDYXXLXY domain-containing protein [Frankiaceae bacterium]